MRIHIPQFSCFRKILKRSLVVPSTVALLPHLTKCSWIIRLHSFHYLLITFFLRFWYGLSTVWTSLIQSLFHFTFCIGVMAASADAFAATWVYQSFRVIKWQWQIANWTLAKMALIRL